MKLTLSIVPNTEPDKDATSHRVVLTAEDAAAYRMAKGWCAKADIVDAYTPQGFFVVRMSEEKEGQA